MPTDRAGHLQQWRVCLGAALLSGPGRRMITSAEVASDVPVGVETVTEVLRFLTTVGLFEGARGKYAVTEAGWAVSVRWQEDETQARLLLQAQFLQHWSAKAAWKALHDAPVEQDVLARRLHENLPGKPRRGLYLVEWLVLALVVQRDRELRISPAPALGAVAATGPATPTAPPQPEPDALLGMTNAELRELPPARYCAVLDGLTRLVELTPA